MEAVALSDEASWSGAVCHTGACVRCIDGREAVVSIVSRSDTARPIRFVLWCSLRACEVCGEHCLTSRGA
jgi:hypothetical protein